MTTFHTTITNKLLHLIQQLPSLGLHNAHWCIMLGLQAIKLLALKISRKKLVRVYNVHGL